MITGIVKDTMTAVKFYRCHFCGLRDSGHVQNHIERCEAMKKPRDLSYPEPKRDYEDSFTFGEDTSARYEFINILRNGQLP